LLFLVKFKWFFFFSKKVLHPHEARVRDCGDILHFFPLKNKDKAKSPTPKQQYDESKRNFSALGLRPNYAFQDKKHVFY
jgi:hypothetical protein